MGTIVAVDSVVYNLAGDEVDRPDYMQSLVVRNVLSGTKETMGDTINAGLMHGPAIQLRNFYRWANTPENYDQVGMPTGALEIRGTIDPVLVIPYIPTTPGLAVWAESAFVDDANIKYWAERWLLVNQPDDYDTAWTVDYDPDTAEMTIVFPDDSSVIVSVPDYEPNGQYLYAYFTEVLEDDVGPTITGDVVTLAVGESFPDTTDWTLLNADADPGTAIEAIYEKVSALDSADGVGTLTETMHQFDDGTGTTRSYRIDSQQTIYRSFSTTQLYIYEIGGGSAELDELVTSGTSYGQFFPFIPFRLNTTFISNTYLPDVYPQIKKAFKKATGGKLDKLIEQLADNENLGDIDNAYVTFGVSLNVLERECRRYIYTFFEILQQSQTGDPAAVYANYLDQIDAYDSAMINWQFWQSNPIGPEPPRPVAPAMPNSVIRIAGAGAINSKYDIRINWKYVKDFSGVGLAKPDAKSGEIWLEHTGTDDIYRTAVINGRDGPRTASYLAESIHHMKIYWQRTAGSYTYLEVVGAVFKNYVYQTHFVEIDTKKALADPDESGFIIPLHYETWRQTPLASSSQMATACCFAVFNCYEVYKTKWYESGIFKILLVVVIAVVSVVFTGGAGLGLLGTNFAVGASLGLTGLTAAIAGAVVNALAALVLATLLEMVTKNLGIIGAILGAVVMILAGQVAGSFSSGSLAINWGDFLRVDNLMKLTDSVAHGVVNMWNQNVLDLQQEALDYAKKSKQDADKIQQAYFKEFGYGGAIIDPNMFVSSANSLIAESSDTFLTRTLMTGSDIADMSRDLLYEFPTYSLKLPDAFT
ncbi:hypothetical protein [Mesorhizobium sp. M4B.F.Ca.ET.058.02.1.1]|uniref:hypothetical protein n=1 Tax=Mesorhizobium sp. M4B.F.Ca.ET.058.02.1.1 TaxID=2493675 RepID=UPI000F74C04E|nr:hypothetical protein [Mesorhizobium sp. M4B.F.Ca.ET.058.02.1.1]AZO48045.1 hypothetical protein EJ073_09595 [Mesorhizobium sp. M4B.F.Ca.ET.058.02.1.1]